MIFAAENKRPFFMHDYDNAKPFCNMVEFKGLPEKEANMLIYVYIYSKVLHKPIEVRNV